MEDEQTGCRVTIKKSKNVRILIKTDSCLVIRIQFNHFVSLTTCTVLTLNLLTTTIVAPPSNASNWQMGFNSAFKGLNLCPFHKLN